MLQLPRATPQSQFNVLSQSINEFLGNDQASRCLYPHQIEAVQRIRTFLANPQQPNIGLAVLPTGTGKTGIAVLTAYAVNASRVLVITPSQKISEQVEKAFVGIPQIGNAPAQPPFLVEQGIITGDRRDLHKYLPPSGLVRNSSEIPNRIRNCFVVTNAHKIGGNSRVRIQDIPRDFDLVIVDEAHHYPADTWKLLVDHFRRSKRLFLTATPLWRGRPILGDAQNEHICYQLTKEQAVQRGVIRPMVFDDEVDGSMEDGKESDAALFQAVARRVRYHLAQHDRQDPDVFHQAMILSQTKININAAQTFEESYNHGVNNPRDRCKIYVAESSAAVVKEFGAGGFRTLIIIGRLLEGYDNKNVSVLGIARNVQPSSHVLFAQFLGRAVRRIRSDDPVSAVLVSHPKFQQRQNFERFEQLPDEDTTEDDE